MNTLSRLDAFIARLASPGAGPSKPRAAGSSPPSLAGEPGPSMAGPSTPFPSSSSSSSSSGPSTSSPSLGLSSAHAAHAPSTSLHSAYTYNSSPTSASGIGRRLRRRRRRIPTGSSIKLPPPTTPLLLRVALALWSILLAFWRSLVGDTRAVRILRHKRRGLRTCDSPQPSPPITPPLPSPALSASSADAIVADAASASSDEGSASEAEWIDPVTRAESDATTRDTDGPSDAEFRRTPSDTAFNLHLRSNHSKETLSIRGVLDPSLPPTPSDDSHPPTPGSEARSDKAEEGDTGPRRRPRLLPNPMSTSLLDSTVAIAPHKHPAPSIAPSPRPPHQTPFHLQKTLILDLDETLIHSTSRPIGSSHAGGGMLGLGSGLFGRRGRREGHTIEVVLNGRSTTYHVYKRPYVDFFLKKVASWYTLVIYTASMPEYADPVIDWLDNGRGLFAKRLYRESCYLQPSGSYIKDLALVDEDLAKVCFMDNSPISYNWNKANALPIEGWTSDPNDEALLQSIPVLDSLRFVTDVRRILGIRGFN